MHSCKCKFVDAKSKGRIKMKTPRELLRIRQPTVPGVSETVANPSGSLPKSDPGGKYPSFEVGK